MMRFCRVILPILVGVLVLASCGGDGETQRQARVDAARSALNASLEETEPAFQHLEAQLADTTRTQVGDGDETVAALRQERRRLAWAIRSLDGATEQDLDEARRAIQHRIEVLRIALAEARLMVAEPDVFEQMAADEMDRLNQAIEAIEARLDLLPDQVRHSYENKLASWQTERQSLAVTWVRLKRNSAETYQHLRADVAQTLAALTHEVEQARQALQETT